MRTRSRFSTRARRLRLVLVLLAASTHSVAADESAATAARRYELGRAAFEAGRFVEAALEFEAAFQAVPHGVALFMAADAWERAGRLEQAADVWSGVPNATGVTPEQKARAEERKQTLERLMGTVIITSSDPASVRLDDGIPRRTPARLHGAAGTRTVVAAIGDQEQRKTVQLQAGQSVTVHLSSLKTAASSAPTETLATTPAALEREGSWWTAQRSLGVALVGAGAAAIGVGAGFGIAARGTKESFDRTPTPALREQGLNEVRWANVGLIGGGVLALTGTGFLLWAPAAGTTGARARLRARASVQTFDVSVEGHF